MKRSRQNVRVAAAQAAPIFLDRNATVSKAVTLIARAAEGGARLVAFSEAFVPCWPAWIFGAAEWEDAGAKTAYRCLLENAVTVPSSTTDELCKAASAANTHVVIGINELDTASGGTLYNSLLYVSNEGEILGVHRKLVPTHAERIIWGVGDGSTLSVFDTSVGRIGGLICWEHWMPLARFAMDAQGEEIHVAAWPEAMETNHLASRHYAFEGRCFVICAACFLTESDVPPDVPCRDSVVTAGDSIGSSPGVILPGGSGVIGPDAEWLTGPVFGEETLVFADLDLSRIAEAQQALDAAGHYNRPDIFDLRIDARPRTAVSWQAEGEGDGTASES